MLPFSYFINTVATQFVIAMPISGVIDGISQLNVNWVMTDTSTEIHQQPCLLNSVPAACWVTHNYHAWFVSSGQGVEVQKWPWVRHSSEAETSHLPQGKWRGTRITVQHSASCCYVYLSPTTSAYGLGTSQPHIQEYNRIFLDISVTAKYLWRGVLLKVAVRDGITLRYLFDSLWPSQSFL